MSDTVTIHPFKAWLVSNRLSQDRAAASLKLARGTLHRYFAALRVMNVETKLAIQALTAGEVPALEICRWELAHAVTTNMAAAA